ncbi:hypothetical protein ACCS78_32070 [Rhizobium johnstonii]
MNPMMPMVVVLAIGAASMAAAADINGQWARGDGIRSVSDVGTTIFTGGADTPEDG